MRKSDDSTRSHGTRDRHGSVRHEAPTAKYLFGWIALSYTCLSICHLVPAQTFNVALQCILDWMTVAPALFPRDSAAPKEENL
jgi:hypothetical protein